MEAEVNYLYRYERGYVDSNGAAFLKLEQYPVLSKTEKGVWIKIYNADKKFVLLTGKKRWAYPTPEEALVNYNKRTKIWVKLLERQLYVARSYLNPKILNNKLNLK